MKRRSDWNGADNARNALSVMLADELRIKREKDASRAGVAKACAFGLFIGIIYTLAHVLGAV